MRCGVQTRVKRSSISSAADGSSSEGISFTNRSPAGRLPRAVNAAAPGAMAAACTELGIPFVHISTDYVFDGSGD